MKIFILSFISFFIFTTNSYAYIDPGVGAMLIQGLIALIAAVTTYAAFYWKKIKDFINKISNSKKNKDLKD
jgi:hypothetical protein|tara:strand:- start:4716 stop:4928 length:213 start_codon:yes stop_codon:yes gene_type:complete